LVQGLAADSRLPAVYQASRTAGDDLHYAAAYGFVGGVLSLGEEETVLSFLQQGIGALLAATQKMMAIGQSQTVGILWRIKPLILAAVERSQNAVPAMLRLPVCGMARYQPDCLLVEAY
jgi:urease accessory protein